MGSVESMTDRVVRVLGEELSVAPRASLARIVSAVIPPLGMNRVRTMLLRGLGLRVGRRSIVMGTLALTGDLRNLEIGEDTMVTGPLLVDAGSRVTIGDRVHIGPEVAILTVSHAIGLSRERCGAREYAPVVIEDGAWVMARATLLPGVTVGRGAMVAAGAVVTHDVEPDTMVGGVPATLMRNAKR